MTSRNRCAALGLTLLLAAAAPGQDGPALAELLKEYRALGLPLPPPTARLVRYETGTTQFADGTRVNEALAFELLPGTKDEPPVLFRGADEWQPFGKTRYREVKPDAAAARDARLDWDERVALAVQCHARGWDDLARALLAPLREGSRPTDPHRQLVGLAWRHWEAQLTHPTADRRPAAARLKGLIGRDPALNTRANRALLKSLDLALAPGKGRPGTVEAEIDALVDHHNVPFDYTPEFAPPVRRLVDRGFDAVPALLAHLTDDRLTRVRVPRFNNSPERILRVRDVAEGLLHSLASESLDERNFRSAAAAWWAKARKTDEEAYLLANVLPPEQAKRGWPRSHMLRVIAAKYPGRLPELYRTVLAQRPDVESWELVEALERAPLTAKAKLDALAPGLGHDDYAHRAPALCALKSLDPRRCEALLLAELESLPAEVPEGNDRLRRIGLTRLAIHTTNPRIWAALERAVRRSTPVQRVEILHGFGYPDEPAHRVERIRFLTAFLDDSAVPDQRATITGQVHGRITVGDAAALELVWMLGVYVPHDPKRTPAEWAKVRDEVRAAARRELDRAE